MAVGFGSFAQNHGTFANSFSVNVPAGTRGVLVFAFSQTETSAVSLGGVALTQLTGSPVVGIAGLTGLLEQGFFLGASVPTGSQTLTLTGPASGAVAVRVYTLTGDDDLEVVDTAVWNAVLANPSATLSLGGRASFCAVDFISDQDAVGSITPSAGWTSRSEFDVGASTLGSYSYDTIGTADVAAGWTQAAEDVAGIAVAIAEVAAAPTYTGALAASSDGATADFAGTYDGPAAPSEGTLAAGAQSATGDFTGTYVPPVRWGVLGDSNSDEYRTPEDPRGLNSSGDPTEWTDTTLNWTELLAQPNGSSPSAVHHRGLNFGTWGARSEPRRTGFANIWARSGAVAQEVIDDQLAGLVAQIEAGEVTYVAIQAAVNDWLDGGMQAIYNSPDGGVTMDGGGTVVGWVSDYVDRVNVLVDDALDAGLQGGIVVIAPPDYLAAPSAAIPYPNATRRGYVASAVASTLAQLEAHADSINTSAGVTRVAVAWWDDLLQSEVYPTLSGGFVTVAGVQVDAINIPDDGDPLHLFVGTVGTGRPHAGTLQCGVIANTFIAAANTLPGISIAPFTDAEIRENAGIESGPYAGDFEAAAEAASADFAGTYAPPEYAGSFDAAAGPGAADFAGTYAAPEYAGALTATAAEASASFTGSYQAPTYAGGLSATSGTASASFAGSYTLEYSGALAAEAEPATADFTGDYATPPGGAILAFAQEASATFTGAYAAPEYIGALAASSQAAAAEFSGDYADPLAYDGEMVAVGAGASAQFAGTYAGPVYAGAFAAVAQAATARFREQPTARGYINIAGITFAPSLSGGLTRRPALTATIRRT